MLEPLLYSINMQELGGRRKCAACQAAHPHVQRTLGWPK